MILVFDVLYVKSRFSECAEQISSGLQMVHILNGQHRYSCATMDTVGAREGRRHKTLGYHLIMNVGHPLIYVSPPPSFQGACICLPQFPPLEEE